MTVCGFGLNFAIAVLWVIHDSISLLGNICSATTRDTGSALSIEPLPTQFVNDATDKLLELFIARYLMACKARAT